MVQLAAADSSNTKEHTLALYYTTKEENTYFGRKNEIPYFCVTLCCKKHLGILVGFVCCNLLDTVLPKYCLHFLPLCFFDRMKNMLTKFYLYKKHYYSLH